jgi:phosphate transport system substrate-binding protein
MAFPRQILPLACSGVVLSVLVLSGCGPSGDGGSGASKGTVGDKSQGADELGEIVTTGDYSALSGDVKVDGSSSLFPVTEAAAEEFQKATKQKVKVRVGEGGTGSGFKRFLREEIDICDASRPITKDEIETAKSAGIAYIELPVCFDALTVAVHPSNKLESITTTELKKMWDSAAQEVITRWNQVNPAWPDEELALFGAGSASGTFEYFTGAIGKTRDSRGDYTFSEDDNILVQGIAGNRNALGYLPYSYYEQNKDKLKALAIDWDKDEAGPVAPSLENVEQGKYNPFARPLFLYVNRKSADRPEVKAFVEFYLKNAKLFATEEKYLPLPDSAYTMASDRFEKLETGTGFKGEPEFGLRVEEILQRPPQN